MHTFHKLPIVTAVVGCIVPGCASRAPEPEGTFRHHQPLVLAESSRCSVELGQLSYDDPGSDDGEYIQLVVRRFDGASGAGSGGTTSQGDAGGVSAGAGGVASSGAGSDSGSSPSGGGSEVLACGGSGGAYGFVDGGATHDDGASVATLGDCGLEGVDLLNGGVDGCPAYRSIDLAGAPIPSDGLVVICSEDSTVAASARCDVTHAGTRKLPNGWLQNGPGDGLTFVATDGTVTEIAYEGVTDGCFSGTPVTLAPETGEAPDGADDVNVACGGQFELRSATEVAPDVRAACEADPEGTPAGDAGSAWSSGSPALDSGHAGAPSETYVTGQVGTLQESVVTDAGRSLLSAEDAGEQSLDSGAGDPPEFGCSAAPRGTGSIGGACAGAALAFASAARRRRRS